MEIQVANLVFSYEHETILEQERLSIPQGSFVGIIGPNGGGKTTFLKLLMGFIKPSQGMIRIFGNTPEKMRTKMGYVPQFHLCDREFPITVQELVLLGAVSRTNIWGVYPKDIKEKALELIHELGLFPFLKTPFGALSGGMAQRALLARALLIDPDLLFLDEPTANVDPLSTELIMDKLDQLKKHKTILLVSHELQTVVERVDQVLCVQKKITVFKPHEVCGHFALGLYHPLASAESKRRPHVLSRG